MLYSCTRIATVGVKVG